tara:strand:- start:12472 stop:12834 length:363 start_codon:yes stop_codon:yes gene_type:complete
LQFGELHLFESQALLSTCAEMWLGFGFDLILNPPNVVFQFDPQIDQLDRIQFSELPYLISPLEYQVLSKYSFMLAVVPEFLNDGAVFQVVCHQVPSYGLHFFFGAAVEKHGMRSAIAMVS